MIEQRIAELEASIAHVMQTAITEAEKPSHKLFVDAFRLGLLCWNEPTLFQSNQLKKFQYYYSYKFENGIPRLRSGRFRPRVA